MSVAAVAVEPAVVQATLALRAEGKDVETCASLLLNGAAVLVARRYTEAEFAELARRMWVTAARQLALLDLLDRVTERLGGERRGLGARGSGLGVQRRSLEHGARSLEPLSRVPGETS